MTSSDQAFLKQLLMACGPSGNEERVQDIWLDRARSFIDPQDCETDVLGNAYCWINRDAPCTIMLAAHIDEIGFMVTHISDKYLYIESVGGTDAKILPGSQVLVFSSKLKIKKPLVGVIGAKAVHLGGSKTSVPITELYVDIGVSSESELKKLVNIGDPITYMPNYTPLHSGKYFTSKSCDDRVGSFVISQVMKSLSKRHKQLGIGICAVSTVQEEVGLRGAKVAAFNVEPKISFVVDVTHSSDIPSVESSRVGTVILNQGPVLHPSPATNKILDQYLRKIAKKKRIPYQLQSSADPYGTDTYTIQLDRSGVQTALISIPNRYMHTNVEVCAYSDLDNAAKLITEAILNLTIN